MKSAKAENVALQADLAAWRSAAVAAWAAAASLPQSSVEEERLKEEKVELAEELRSVKVKIERLRSSGCNQCGHTLEDNLQDVELGIEEY